MNKNDDHIINTSSVKIFRKALHLLTHMSQAKMLAVTGVAGIGKTKAVDHFISHQAPQPHTGYPPCIKITVPPKPTSLTLTTSILDAINERPRGRNAKEFAEQVMEAMRRHDFWLIVDEADRLNSTSFDMLRYIHDQAQRPITLVALPKLRRILEPHEQFNSRVALEVKFEPLDLDELTSSFLPQLQYSKWKFNPDLDVDRELAQYVWKIAKPSLRWLVHWIDAANGIAEEDDLERVTLDTMIEVSEIVKLNSTKSQDDLGDKSTTESWEEVRSELRKRAKK